jgi:DNA-binding transcriptional LysR family regulator
MRTPFDARGLDSDEFLREPRVVLLKEDNPLAARPDTELRHLAGLPIIRCVPDRGNGVLL